MFFSFVGGAFQPRVGFMFFSRGWKAPPTANLFSALYLGEVFQALETGSGVFSKHWKK